MADAPGKDKGTFAQPFRNTVSPAGIGPLDPRRKISLVIEEDCVGCEVCIDVCPTDSLRMIGNIAWSNPLTCDGDDGCGECAPVCPVECIKYAPTSDPRVQTYGDKHAGTRGGYEARVDIPAKEREAQGK